MDFLCIEKEVMAIIFKQIILDAIVNLSPLAFAAL
jgi:hypothetical protein